MAKRVVDQDRFLGALLGMAIGDALGMPVAGWEAGRIRDRFVRIDGYHARVFPDGAEVKAGEFTDESEIALCVVESFTVNQGTLDPDNVGARLDFLARGESRRWLRRETLAAIARNAGSGQWQVPIDEDGPAGADVLARGVPVGLIHAVGAFDQGRLGEDAELVARLTHGSPLAIAAATAVAYAVQLAARGEIGRAEWLGSTAEAIGVGTVAELLGEAGRDPRRFAEATAADGANARDDAPRTLASAVAIAATASDFEGAVLDAVNLGGPADSRGAVAGALFGAAEGVAAIPQRMIDELEGRIYVSLAGPWFYRTAMRRAGLLIDLRLEE